ncbi:MAG: 4Fe-4S ferredoxin, partial [Oscillospiraceae bacterium]
MPTPVYFSDFRALPGTNLLVKLQKLIRTAGIGKLDFDGKLVAIKM